MRSVTTGRGRASAVAFAVVLALAMLPGITGAGATPPAGNPAVYTLDTHFSEGSLINVNFTDVADQLQMNSAPTPFDFIWVAVSSQGTVVKIDTTTGAVLGEYRTAPMGMGTNPSRTTVDNNGSVWVANRAESGFVNQDAIAPGMPPASQPMGSVVHIGLEENGQCVDRNTNGVIDTSTGLGDVLAWSNGGGADTLGGVTTADDECIVHFTRITSTGSRHLSVDAGNDVWASGTGFRNFDLIDGVTGAIVRHEPGVGFGGYGGLIDGNGVIWSARPLLYWDTALSPIAGNSTTYFHDSYGLCIDSLGNVWNTALFGNTIRKFAPNGVLMGTFSHGANTAQGCVVDGNDHVWVAHSLIGPSTTVGHLLPDGTWLGNVTVGSGPTGVAVDGAGKVWATNYNSQTVSRIDPAGGPLGTDGLTPVGAVNFTTVDLGGLLYNYSDMTGSTLIAPPTTGTWTFVHDSGLVDAPWRNVSWNSLEPAGSSITVSVGSSDFPGGPFVGETVTNGVDLAATPPGQYLEVVVTFDRADGFDPTPVLYDITLLHNQDPDCSDAFPSIDHLWPPNHKFHDVTVEGVTDPDGDPVAITITSIFQDEPTDTFGDGAFTPDGMGVGTDTAMVRAERSGNPSVPGNGRVYYIGFTAEDGLGGVCEGVVEVGVPHDVKDTPIPDGALFDSTI